MKFAYIISKGITAYDQLTGPDTCYESEKELRKVYGDESVDKMKEAFKINTHLTGLAEYIISDS